MKLVFFLFLVLNRNILIESSNNAGLSFPHNLEDEASVEQVDIQVDEEDGSFIQESIIDPSIQLTSNVVQIGSESLSPLVSGVTDILGQHDDAIESTAEFLNPSISAATSVARPFVKIRNRIRRPFDDAVDALTAPLTEPFEGFGPALTEATQPVRDAVNPDLAEALEPIHEALEPLTSLTGDENLSFETLGSDIDNAVQETGDFIRHSADVVATVTGGKKIFKKVGKLLAKAKPIALPVLKKAAKKAVVKPFVKPFVKPLVKPLIKPLVAEPVIIKSADLLETVVVNDRLDNVPTVEESMEDIEIVLDEKAPAFEDAFGGGFKLDDSSSTSSNIFIQQIPNHLEEMRRNLTDFLGAFFGMATNVVAMQKNMLQGGMNGFRNKIGNSAFDSRISKSISASKKPGFGIKFDVDVDGNFGQVEDNEVVNNGKRQASLLGFKRPTENINTITVVDSLERSRGVRESSEKPEWGYTGKNGPEFWASEVHSNCGGLRQSPIDLDLSITETRNFLPLNTTNYDRIINFKYSNNNHSVKGSPSFQDITLTGGPLNNDIYQFAQFHFHWGVNNDMGSEHTINGRRFPLEIHLVHFNKKYGTISEALNHGDGLAVVGKLYSFSPSCMGSVNELDNVLQGLAISTSPSATFTSAISLNDLVSPSEMLSFLHYDGSLTTPTCNEAVQWIVLTDTSDVVCQRQMEWLRSLRDFKHGKPIGNNFRPIQRLERRSILKSS